MRAFIHHNMDRYIVTAAFSRADAGNMQQKPSVYPNPTWTSSLSDEYHGNRNPVGLWSKQHSSKMGRAFRQGQMSQSTGYDAKPPSSERIPTGWNILHRHAHPSLKFKII